MELAQRVGFTSGPVVFSCRHPGAAIGASGAGIGRESLGEDILPMVFRGAHPFGGDVILVHSAADF